MTNTELDNLRWRVKALEDTVQAIIKRTSRESEDLKYRIELLEASRTDAEETAITQEQQAPKPPMRIRVNANRTAKGYSVEATLENTQLVPPEWADELEAQALARLESLMSKLNEQYPREA